MRRAAFLFPLLGLLAAAGCTGGARADRAPGPEDLECTLEAVGLQPEGGLPVSVRITVCNVSKANVAFTLPRPLIDEQTAGQMKEPLIILALAMTDPAGHEECAVYTHPQDKAPRKARTVVVGPGARLAMEFPLAEFYFWGPCGPDTGGNFTRYFWRGDKELAMRAVLINEAAKTRIESKPVTIRCTFEDWLFQKKPVR